MRTWQAPPRVVVNALLVGSMGRLIALQAHSLWVDEAATWAFATKESWRDTVFAESNHPPVWRALTRLWVEAFGDREFSLRAPAALLGILAIYLAWRLALAVFDPAHAPSRGGFEEPPDRGRGAGAAAWVAALAAANAYWIEYAQEARPYSLLLVETLASSLLYLRWLHRGGAGTLAAYAALAALSLYTHYFAVLPLLAHGAHALLTARRAGGAPFPPFLLAQVAAALIFLPWVLHLRAAPGHVSPGETYEPFGRLVHSLWRMGIGPALVALDRLRVELGPDAVYAQQRGIVVASSLLWGVPILFGVRAMLARGGAGLFVLLSALLPVALVLAVFAWFPLIHEKYLIVIAPFLLLLAVAGARSAPGLLKPVLFAGLALVHAAGFVAYHFTEHPEVSEALSAGYRYGKEQWRDARAWVAERAEPGDVVVVPLLARPTDPELLKYAWEYYDRGRLATAYVAGPPASAEEVREKVAALAGAKRVFLLLSHEAVRDRAAWIAALLPDRHRLHGKEFNRSWGILGYEFVD